MGNEQTVQVFGTLHTILEAGEKGYAVAAANVNNRGLRVLFKSYAQQRANFKAEILAEIYRLGGDLRPRSSLRGIIHRGRINIFAALIIERDGRDEMVVNEILFGESVAQKTYEKILKKGLPAESQALVERQYYAVSEVFAQVRLMRGQDGKRLVVRLYDSEQDVEKAIRSLEQAGLPPKVVEKVSLDKLADLYTGRGSTVAETLFSGAVGGAMWGSLLGSLAGLGAMTSTGVDPLLTLAPQMVWAMVALAGIAGGALVGAVLGFFIGLGIAEEDAYHSNTSLASGQTIIRILLDEARVKEVGYILTLAQIQS